MARSLFVLASERPAATAAQLRRIRNEFRGEGLGLEGPYSDRRDALEEITYGVKTRVKFSAHDLLHATLMTLAPQNPPVGVSLRETSWLREPFVLTVRKGQEVDEKQTAGEVASSEPVKHREDLARIADSQEITMVAVSVLRRLGIESFYAVAHLNRSFFEQAIAASGIQATIVGQSGSFAFQEPCVLIPEGKKAKIMRFAPPEVLELGGSSPITAVEVLDNDALRSLLIIKSAASEARNLMEEGANHEFESGAAIRAAGIGHAIHQSRLLWTPDQAHEGIDAAISMVNPSESPVIESVRETAEREHVHPITCHGCHTLRAGLTLLCDGAKTVLVALGAVTHGKIWEESPQGPFGKIIEALTDHSCVRRFGAYMELANTMNTHIHPLSECEIMKTVN